MGPGSCETSCIPDEVVYDSGLANNTCSELLLFDIMLLIVETPSYITCKFEFQTSHLLCLWNDGSRVCVTYMS